MLQIIEPQPKALHKKKKDFLVKSLYKFGYENFSHRNGRVTRLWKHHCIYNIIWFKQCNFIGDVMDKDLFQNTFILRRSKVTNFADIIKITNIFIKSTLKD